MSYALPNPDSMATQTLATLRIGHLQMIQGVISRLATNSSTAKNACVALTAALIAIFVTKPNLLILLVLIASVAVFAFLDAKYLSLERAYRKFYQQVSLLPIEEATNMNVSLPGGIRLDTLHALTSWSIISFYPPIIVATAALSYVIK